MNVLLLFFIGLIAHATSMVNSPAYVLYFCYSTPNATYTKKLSWNEIRKDLIHLQHGKVTIGLQVERIPEQYVIKLGRVDSESESISFSNGLTLNDKNHADNATYGGGGSGPYSLYMVPKSFDKVKLQDLCPGKQQFELKLID